MKRSFLSKNPRINRLLVMAEMAITAGIFCIPIMSEFYESEIHMNSFMITLSQIIFTVVAMILNTPLGWLADKFSRKWANIIGDSLSAISLILYSQANSFGEVVLCECLFGVGSAFSKGVDSTLLQHFCDKEDPSEKHYRRYMGLSASINQIACLAILVIGMPLTRNFRLCIAASSITYWIGAVLSLLINDDSKKLKETKTGTDSQPKKWWQKVKEAFDSLKKITSDTIHNPELNTRIAAYVIARECTHPIVWIYPLVLKDIGMAVATFSLYWCGSEIFSYLGTRFGRIASLKMAEWKRFLVPVILVCASSLIIFIKPCTVTIWFYFAFGAAKGWASACMMFPIKEHTERKISTTVESITTTISQLTYIVSSAIVGLASLIGHHYGFLATVIFFGPAAVITAIKLRKQTEKEKKA